MKIKPYWIVLAGLLAGCSAMRPGVEASEESTQKAKAIYAEIVNKLSRVNTVSFNYHLVIDDHDMGSFNDGTYTFQKPGLSRAETSDTIRITDNEKSTNIYLSLNEYRQRSIIHGSEEADFEYFGFDPIVLGKATPTSVQPLLTTLQGRPVVLTHLRDGSNQVDVFYSVDTKLPIKCVITKPGFLIWGGEKKAYTYSNVALNAPVSKDLFTVDYKRYKPMDVYEGQIDSSKIGTQCPDFEVNTIQSEHIRLIDELKTQKAMVLTFWSHGWGPCSAELPYIEKLHKQFKDQGLSVLAVCDNGTEEETQQTWNDESFTMPCAQNGTGLGDLKQRFGIANEPIIIVIDSNRTIVAVFDDYYPEAMTKTLEKLGFK